MARLIELPVIPDPVEMWELVEDEIIRVYKQELFLPLIRELIPGQSHDSILRNALDDLIEAIMTGRISFEQGRFKGKFDSRTSKELRRLGAEFDKRDSSYVIRSADLPVEVKAMISASEAKLNRQLTLIDRKLAAFSPSEITDKLNLTKLFDRTLFKVNKQFEKNVKGLVVPAQVSPEQRMEIALSWKDNLDLYIKDFTNKQTQDLRTMIEKNAWSGARRESVVTDIQSRYGVTQNKAKFWARQETNLMMEAWSRSRYQENGIEEYKWRNVAGSPNHPVRASHKALGDQSRNGKTFKWTDPPLMGDNGQMCHPKQDYNCRCYAQPVVRV